MPRCGRASSSGTICGVAEKNAATRAALIGTLHGSGTARALRKERERVRKGRIRARDARGEAEEGEGATVLAAKTHARAVVRAARDVPQVFSFPTRNGRARECRYFWMTVPSPALARLRSDSFYSPPVSGR